jgi:predicted phosphate transport protein (TIGR00153 family)
MPRFGLPLGEDRFYTLLGQSADNLVAAADLLAETMEDFAHLQLRAERMRELEHHGDFLTHQIMNQLQQTFVTPIDREDIAMLAQRMDDVLDHVDAAVTALCDYEIPEPTPTAREMAEVIRGVSATLAQAMASIRRSELKAVLPLTVEINRLENQGDHLFREAMRELFRREGDVRDIIKWREVYDELEAATDSAEDVANVMEGVVLKYG